MNDVKITKEGLTLQLERHIAAPRGTVWRCWTQSDLLKKWYCPKPWHVSAADLDVEPGGRMNVTMQGPAGEKIDANGVFLKIVPGKELVFSDSHREGFVPAEKSFMTGFVTLSDADDGGTLLTWGARHASEQDRQAHLDMGFEPGWTAASQQLAELAESLIADDPLAGGPVFSAKTRACVFVGRDAEAAAMLYTSLLPDSRIETIVPGGPDGGALVVEFTLAGVPYMAMNGNPEPVSSNLMSISILTDDQAETDRLWQALLAGGGEESRCGWVKDRFGAYWQVVPKTLPDLVHTTAGPVRQRVMDALMSMTKIDEAALKAAAGI